jgi:hypothetical protein
MHKIQTISIGRLFLTTQNDQTALFLYNKKDLKNKNSHQTNIIVLSFDATKGATVDKFIHKRRRRKT